MRDCGGLYYGQRGFNSKMYVYPENDMLAFEMGEYKVQLNKGEVMEIMRYLSEWSEGKL